MTEPLPAWIRRASDLGIPGWEIRRAVGYQLMFEFLRLSPSYELARREAEEGLTSFEASVLPADFTDVRHTYALLGNVQNIIFRNWWLQRGLHVFGNPNTKPRVHDLGLLPEGQDVAVADVVGSMEQYLEDSRRDEGLVASLLLAVPLGARKSEVLRQIGMLLDRHVSNTQPAAKPVLALLGQRLRAKVLFSGIRLLSMRAAQPKLALWRLGAKARLSPTYSEVLDPDAPRKVSDPQEMIDREMMSKITHRALLKFEAIAENAARAQFPSDAPVEQAPFDYPKLARVIKRRNAWEAVEKARMMKEMYARAARHAASRTTGPGV